MQSSIHHLLAVQFVPPFESKEFVSQLRNEQCRRFSETEVPSGVIKTSADIELRTEKDQVESFTFCFVFCSIR